ncbi:sushi, von Willebrand factor type A, EGF and pentraxin domain-containing protein 1-like isoform X1 [Argiope bruennichi]|uniref:sushi, von Willebrand factor type A, EGF and pentraxin domain-containing protein 1-like isoform X1 n=1 Tax=Argiope bruennichi TaxID=94029 RepID=UPI0024945FC7|nr:sushi, von Willebrand factor type A, EGF and pentraxin domain-containing protein 1-like isoform X1 [Argiope bruennichi]
MAAAFIFSIFLQALLYAICSGETCSDNWSTETTKYTILKFKEDAYLHVSCRYPNFKVDGNVKVIKCKNGQLPTIIPQCILLKESCRHLKAPTYGSMKCSSTAPEVGSSCTFECQNSHYLRGSSTRTCSDYLRWTGSEARCYLKPECSEPPPLIQGTVTGCSPERKPRYNDTCHFRCNEGYQLSGPTHLICRRDGRLTDEKGHQRFPRCLKKLPANPGPADKDILPATPGPSEKEILPVNPGPAVNLGGEDFQSAPHPDIPTYGPSCQVRNGHCSHQCHQEPNGVRCSCNRGYELSQDGRTCIDIDECRDVDLNNCDHICRNRPGGYDCLCREGHISPDGFRCTDIDECLDDNLNKCEHICQNTIEGYNCSCRAGYVSTNGFRCEGCRMNSYQTKFDTVCRDCPAHSHTDGEAKTSMNDCICNLGFNGNPGQRIPCKDIDECADGKNFGCSHGCVNTPGSAHCTCPLGYQLKDDGKTCTDIDECSIKNGGCDGICHNTVGNFTCSCPEGYVDSPNDRYSCDDLDECMEGNGGCSDKCVNFKGGFHCFCSEGYHLHPDGKSCIPINCPRPSVPQHSTLRCKKSATSSKVIFRPREMPEDEEFPVGAICRVKCNKGYDLRDTHSEIVCQNNGKWNAVLSECQVLKCPPLSPPSNGDVYPPSCKKDYSAVKQKCVFTCLPGYRITGQEVLTCRNNLTWSKKKPTRCVPETEVSISCPDDDITIELTSDESWAEIRLNSPRTTQAAGPIRISPPWVSLDQVSPFPAGETEVTFSVSGDNKTAECSISVIVLDTHPPIFHNCPNNLFVTSSVSGTAVDWEEPVAEDNVGVASVSKSLEPNSTLSPGIHFVEYIARDFAGNIGQCIFYINVTSGVCKDLADPENGEANCQEWMFGKICQPTCFDNYTRDPELFACDESGTWTPADFITPCLAECSADEIRDPEHNECVKIF